ncbi:hypothetical protein NKJ28_28470 [Mesorhizobium sp. M0145]|uniref:hypothetical protein n=1 Tax=Mesorhizobium sp. M0145 TaxID=2956895 RepID=UPI003335C6FF
MTIAELSTSSSGPCRTASKGGDAAKRARTLIQLEGELPRRFLAGADPIATALNNQ